MPGAGIVAPFCGQAWFGLDQDGKDRLTVFCRQVGEVRALVLTAQNLQQAMIDVALGWLGQRVKGRVVDQVAAGIFEDAIPQIEIAQLTALGIAHPARGEFTGEGR